VRDVLARQGLGDADAERFARWSRGSPGDALALANKGARPMRELLAAVLAGARPPLECARELAEIEGEFQGDKPSAREREPCARGGRPRARGARRLQTAPRRARRPDGLAHGDLAASTPALAGRAACSARSRPCL
jgi:hypothetical protein